MKKRRKEKGEFFYFVEISDGEIMAIATAVVNKYYKGERALRRDLIGESVAGVLKACASYRDDVGCKFSTYAYKCAKNEVATYMRRERKWRELMSEKDVDVDEIIGEDMSENLLFRQQENLDRLMAVCRWFKKDRDKVIVSEILSGKKISSIADEFGVSKQSISRVFVKMKKLVRIKFKYEDGEVIER